ncbi:MAG: threonine--tRNA ligase, partial [Cellulomonadaceae bacterium]|nr:threonine--tRNA ligase [Cellulomonadaceae bacterium]
MSQISLTVDGVEQVVPAPVTGADLFGARRDVVVVRVDGELRDLATELTDGAVVESVTIGSPDGLAVLRHSTAHVLAQAVQEINPSARLGIGPPITDGFYYDFDVETPFTPEDLKAIEKAMGRIVKEGQTFRRWDVTEAEARDVLAAEPYKLELIGLKGDAGSDDGASVEVGLGGLSIYQNVRGAGRETEQVVWQDLCRG